MADVQRIEKNGTLYALFFHKGITAEGVRFLTEPTSTLQVGLLEHKPGYEAKAHQHSPRKFDVTTMGEFLFIESGKVQVQVYTEEWEKLADETLVGGEFLLFLAGGHGLTVMESARIIEVKQGPYMGALDKIYQQGQ